MVQQQTHIMHPEKIKHPRRRDLFFHGIKTIKLIGRLLRDRRVPLHRKALFLGAAFALLVILLFPDLLGEFIMSTVLPLIGTVMGVPIDAGFDWLVFALTVVNMLHFFPAEIVAEHYQALFHQKGQ